MQQILVSRMRKEIQMLESEPPPGISCWPKGDKITELEAVITGPEGSPYEKGYFKIDIIVPERYPMEPPNMMFITKIYHPNVDEGGRICLDTLVPAPKGQWKPSLNVSVALQSIRLLLSTPNPDDGLVPEISEECKNDPKTFAEKARQWTLKFAASSAAASDSSEQVDRMNEEGEKEKEETNHPTQDSAKKRDRVDEKPREDDDDDIILEETNDDENLVPSPKRQKTEDDTEESVPVNPIPPKITPTKRFQLGKLQK